jgi:hypothetical protein
LESVIFKFSSYIIYKGVERVTIPLRAQEEMGTIPAVKQALPHYNSMRFQKINGQQIKDRLFKYEDQLVRTVYKFGILYCKEGQTSEDEMYNNRTCSASPRLIPFFLTESTDHGLLIYFFDI